MAILIKGTSGPQVKLLQSRLNKTSVRRPRLLEDGIFGLRTFAYVKEFQRAHELPTDGIVGPQTYALIAAKMQVALAPGVYDEILAEWTKPIQLYS